MRNNYIFFPFKISAESRLLTFCSINSPLSHLITHGEDPFLKLFIAMLLVFLSYGEKFLNLEDY